MKHWRRTFFEVCLRVCFQTRWHHCFQQSRLYPVHSPCVYKTHNFRPSACTNIKRTCRIHTYVNRKYFTVVEVHFGLKFRNCQHCDYNLKQYTILYVRAHTKNIFECFRFFLKTESIIHSKKLAQRVRFASEMQKRFL